MPKIRAAKLRPVMSMIVTARRLPACRGIARCQGKSSGVHSEACDTAGSGPSGLAPIACRPASPAMKWSMTSQASAMSFSVSGSRWW